MNRVALVFLLLLLAFGSVARINAQTPAAAKTENPFDLSAANELMGDFGLPTVQSVGELEKQTQASFAAGDCKSAVETLDKFARQSNALANLIAGGLEPFYDASYDERKKFSPVRLQQLIPFEESANKYKQKRNEAMVMQAECFVKLGEPKKAAGLFYQALRLTALEDWELWERARNGLYALLGVQ